MSTTKTATMDQIREILRGEFRIEPDMVQPETGFVEDLGLDSLDTVELVMAVEETFGIEIDDEDAEQASTVQQLVDLVERLRP